MEKSEFIKYNQFYIFGAGSTAVKVLDVLKLKKKVVSSFIISSLPSKNNLNGIKIKELSLKEEFDITVPIIIGIFNREENAFLPKIICNLQSFGFEKIITYPEFHSFYYDNIGVNFWLTNKEYYSKNIQKYIDVLSLLDDQISIDCYNQIINYLTTFDPLILKKFNSKHQYFPGDLNVWNGKNAFIDIGSFDGQNIVDAYNTYGLLDLVIAFEPDLTNYKNIVTNLRLKDISKQYFIYPCGVWSETKFLNFNSGNGESSSQCKNGDQIISVVKLDEVINVIPGYLKMDIEGSEIDALLGSKEFIIKHKPSLAICLYHSPDHFYEIPKLIASWNLNYKLYIRQHGNNLFETVLYCIQNS